VYISVADNLSLKMSGAFNQRKMITELFNKQVIITFAFRAIPVLTLKQKCIYWPQDLCVVYDNYKIISR